MDTLHDTIEAAAHDLGATIHCVGNLDETAPCEIHLEPTVALGRRHQPIAKLWVTTRFDGTRLLQLSLPLRSFEEDELDVAAFRLWAFHHHARFRFGTVCAWEMVTDGKEVHEATVQHTLTPDVTRQGLTTVLQGLAATWRCANRELAMLAASRLCERQPKRAKHIPDRASVLDELDELVGLEPVKRAVRQLEANQVVARMRADAGMRVASTSPHLVFTGNPGTGKTTVAKLVGRLYRSLGLLSSGHVIETDRSSLVAGYVGQTALRTRAVCESALGGVLFIDEAYALHVEGRDFGTEAVETLLTFMEEHRGELVVVAAGYPTEMHRFIGSNPGLASRFDMTIDFPDYTTEELFRILVQQLTAHDYTVERRAIRHLRAAIAAMPRGQGFGNAREMRRLFNSLVGSHAELMMDQRSPSPETLRDITVQVVCRATKRPPEQRAVRTAGTPTNLWAGYL